MNQTFIERHRAEYQTVIRSPYWKKLKALKVKVTGDRCEKCGCRPMKPELHHKHYKTLGREQPGDVLLVCVSCHAQLDREREAQGRANRQSALDEIYRKGLETYVRKKHGLEPHECDPFDFEEEFDEWRDRKAERDD